MLDSRRLAITWLGCAALVLACAAGRRAGAEARDRRPNMVVVLVDDLRWDALGATGHPFARTPNIDRLAREGAVFKNAFVTLPLCSPSRASFLTGQYASRHGVTDNSNRSALSHQLLTFPALLQRAGYETAYVGKWHMGNDDAPRPGFNHWVSFKGQGAYKDPELNVNGSAAVQPGYMTDLLTEHSLEFIRRRHERPYCLMLAHKAVHGPFTPADRHQALYVSDPVTRSAGAQDDLSGKPALRRGRPAGAGAGGGPPDELIRNQLRCLAAIDESVGRLTRALDGAGELDRTVFVFTSDNGFFWGEHGLSDKRAAYEESLRIPLIVRYPPRVKAGPRSTMALNVDLAPTLLEIGKAKRPSTIQGLSLFSSLCNPSAGSRKVAYFHYYAEPQFPRVPSWRAVRSPEWKYIEYADHPEWSELYELKSDPFELKNRIADPAAARELRRLRSDMKRLSRDAGDLPQEEE